jgi:hypothetical protein
MKCQEDRGKKRSLLQQALYVKKAKDVEGTYCPTEGTYCLALISDFRTYNHLNGYPCGFSCLNLTNLRKVYLLSALLLYQISRPKASENCTKNAPTDRKLMLDFWLVIVYNSIRKEEINKF